MCTRNELNLILQAMTQAYQAVYGANVVKIILYGSYARGFRYRYSRYCTGR